MLESSKEKEDDEDTVDLKKNSERLLLETYIHFSDCTNNGGNIKTLY